MAFDDNGNLVPDLALIDGFVIDCLLSDTHTLDSEVTEFPVESGSTISDNIRPKPLVVAMECLVSNTPLEFAQRFRKATAVPVDDAYALLLSIRKDRRIVSISTSLDNFDNMALESLSIPRAAGRGDELRFNATFKQIEIVINKRGKRVAIPAAQDPTSQNSVSKVQSPYNFGAYIDGFDFSWYDVAISGWRRRWRVSSRHPGDFDLVSGAPVYFTQREYEALPDEERTNPSLRAKIFKLQGNKTLGPFATKSPKTVSLIPATQLHVVFA